MAYTEERSEPGIVPQPASEQDPTAYGGDQEMPSLDPTRKPISVRTRFEVFKRDEFTCRYCGRQSPLVVLHIDHIVPVIDGGTNDVINLVTACSDCNLGKSDVPLGAVITSEDPAQRTVQIRQQEEALRAYNMEILARDERVAVDRRVVYEAFINATDWSCMRASDFNWLMSTVEDVPVEVVLQKIDAASRSGCPKRTWISYVRACINRWRREGF